MAEVDPHGIEQHAPGAKLDYGKNRLELVLGSFANALLAVGRVGTFGANKYTDDGWTQVPSGVARYTGAGLRHLMEELRYGGSTTDEDSSLEHDEQHAWNALARLELRIRKQIDKEKEQQ